jgi:Uma2 family endonuclease
MQTMSSASARRRPGFDELYRQIAALPAGITGQILEAGVLTTMSRPGVAHEWALGGVEESLRDSSMRRSGRDWWILREMEIRFPEERLAVPDLAGWRVDHVPVLPRDNPMLVLPEWCCEVLSPSTTRDDRLLKLPLYAEARVSWVWLVDPELRSIEVYQSVEGRATQVAVARDDESAALPPFESTVEVGAWWMKNG